MTIFWYMFVLARKLARKGEEPLFKSEKSNFSSLQLVIIHSVVCFTRASSFKFKVYFCKLMMNRKMYERIFLENRKLKVMADNSNFTSDSSSMKTPFLQL